MKKRFSFKKAAVYQSYKVLLQTFQLSDLMDCTLFVRKKSYSKLKRSQGTTSFHRILEMQDYLIKHNIHPSITECIFQLNTCFWISKLHKYLPVLGFIISQESITTTYMRVINKRSKTWTKDVITYVMTVVEGS